MANDTPVPQITAVDAGQWRAWLSTHHDSATAVWLIFFKKASGRASVSWAEAVEEALCFGWIDSKVQRIDEASYRQYWTPRRPTSVWSTINKDTVARLMADGRMMSAGLAAVEVAKANGSWTILDGPEAGIIPDDLADALTAAGPEATATFAGFSPSVKRAALYWVASAKRPATRERRIRDVGNRAAQGLKPTPLGDG